MPDPNLKLPVRAERKDGYWCVVDADGNRVPGSEEYQDEGEASTEADRINETWRRAGATRKAKGAPEVTREALDVAVEARERASRDGDTTAFVRARAREVELRARITEAEGSVRSRPVGGSG